jgi:DNA-binding beta-propeller fold protein YncE
MATRTAAPTRTFRSAWRGLACALVYGAVISCTASGSDIQLPRNQLAFPTGMAISPDTSMPPDMATPDKDKRVLFVVNANSELRYDSGSLGVIGLGRVRSVIDAWLGYLAPPKPTDEPKPTCETFAKGLPTMVLAAPDGGSALDCSCDAGNADTLECDEAYFINQDAGVRVGNFATDLSVQDFGSKLRVFVPTRGDPSVAWADFDGTTLHCGGGSDPFPLCDDAHRLTSLNNDPDLAALPSEPFAVFADVVRANDAMGNPVPPTHGFAMVAHLSTGSVTLINAPADSSQVQITDILGGLFASTSGAGGATSIAGRRMPIPAPPPPPEPNEGVPELVPESIYVASNVDNRVQLFDVGMRGGSAGYLLPGTFFVLGAVGASAGNSSDTRGLRFSADGSRLYLVNRAPPSLQVYDTSLGPTGVPKNTLLGSSDLCRGGSAAAVAGAGSDERVYVTCFQDGQIYVVNPFGQSQVEDIISVGRGPYAAVVAVLPNTDPVPPSYLFVSNFLEDTIAVIDITPNHPTRDRVVLRIGTPRTR